MKCKEKLFSKRLVLAIGLAVALGGSTYGQAAVQTEPLIVTEKDKVIDDDFQVLGHKYPAAIYVDSASTGTVQVNSKTIQVENAGENYEDENDIGIIDTGYGWTGKLNLKDGMQITGNFTGPVVNAKGIQLNGFEFFTKTDDTGVPYTGTAQLGKNLSVGLTADQATDRTSLRGIEVDGENLQAGNGLSITASAHTGNWGEVQGFQLIHYGTARLGDHVTIHTSNQIDQDSTHNLTDGIMTVHNFYKEKVDEPAKGRQTLTIGNDASILTEAHNDQDHTIQDGNGEVEGVRLSHTDFTLGEGAQIQTIATGTIPNAFGIYTDYHTQAVIGNNLTNTVTAEGKVPFAIGIQVKNNKNQGEVDETVPNTLTIGERGKTVVSTIGDGIDYTRGIDIEGGQVILKDNNTLQVSGTDTRTQGNTAHTEGVRLTKAGNLEAGNNLQLTVQAKHNQFSYGLEQNDSRITIGNHFTNTLQATDTDESDGGLSVNSQLTIGDDSLNEVQAKGEAPYFWITGYDIEGKTADGSLNLDLGNRARTQVTYEGNTSHQLELYGVYDNNALSQIGDDASIAVSAPALTDSNVDGILNDKGTMTIGRNAAIQVRALGGKRGYGLYNEFGNVELGDGASILLDTNAVQNAAVFSAARGNVLFDGGMKVRTGADQDALSAKFEGRITALGEGTKQIYGNLLSAGGGTIDLSLTTPDSLLRGKSTVESGKTLSGALASGTTNLTLKNGAR